MKQDYAAGARKVEDIKKTGRGVYPGPEVSRSKRTVDVFTSQPLAKPNLATCQRNVVGTQLFKPGQLFSNLISPA